MKQKQESSGFIWGSEDVEDEYRYRYNQIKPYMDKLKKYKALLVRDFKGIDSSDEDKKKLLYEIINIPYEMIESDQFDFEEIKDMIDEDVCEELDCSVDYVTEKLREEYINTFWLKHSEMAQYYEYM